MTKDNRNWGFDRKNFVSSKNSSMCNKEQRKISFKKAKLAPKKHKNMRLAKQGCLPELQTSRNEVYTKNV